MVGLRTPTIDAKVAECLHIASVFERAGDFDIIHNGFDFLPLTYSDLVTTPVVTTIHGFSSPRIVPVYERYDGTTAYVAISDADRHPSLHYAATIHHGIDIDGFGIHPSPASTCCSSVGSTPTRAPPRLSRSPVDAAAGSIIAGIIQDEQLLPRQVAPHVDGEQVRYLGAVDAADRERTCSAAPTPCCT